MKHVLHIALVVGLAHSAVAQSYTAEELKPLAGQNRSYAFAINDAGTVVGQIGTFSGAFEAARWVGASPEPLGSVANYPFSLALGINNAGQIVGVSSTGGGDGVPFIWENGTMSELPYPPGYTWGEATAIEDNGLIAGSVYSAGSLPRPCVWRLVGGVWTPELPALGSAPEGAAFGTNSLGSVVGYVIYPGFEYRAARWDAGSLTFPTIGPPGVPSAAWDISDSGQILGTYVDNGVGECVLLSGPSSVLLGHLPNYTHLAGFRVSASGVVVGHGYNGIAYDGRSAFTDSRAFVWNGTLHAINPMLTGPAGADIRQARDINASGQIAAIGAMNGVPNYRAFRLTPCIANCDGSTTVPILNVNDFICFQTRYAAGDPYANCDNSTIPPVLNVNDFICFQTKFAAGCP